MISLDRDRLAAVLGMLGSRHDGEVVAARTAERMRLAAGATWKELIAPTPAPLKLSKKVRGARRDIEKCLRFEDHLSPWEIGFLKSLQRQQFALSDKQRGVVAGIVAKLAEAGVAR